MAKSKKSKTASMKAKSTSAKSAGKKSKKPAQKAVASKNKKSAMAAKKVSKKAAPKTSSKGAAKKSSAPKSAAAKGNVSKNSNTKSGSSKFVNLAQVFAPLDDRVLVAQAEAATRTAGGLYIPDTVQDRPQQGQVLAVGRGHRDKKGRLRPLDVKTGDTVLFGEYSGAKLELMGNQVVILRENEILGVIKG